ncbi:lysine biosynthesis protein LysX [Pyrobaculum aerophilum]|uniref:Lysine biosynthesis protein LysX n=1 Tax=Pyrobaculum aerophilum TaxID=13773 RepID=A0A832T1X3_9CREN|nr:MULTISPECIES: lysine biosynthesis protein LysX [Pyrobaculum]MCX8136342.1 lysine biosynthesis protein LysX [Pyrobaculum aerophilum]HII47714.1 lysine biosynthesis protein LysX [Pyrobaculum aerophilum]
MNSPYFHPHGEIDFVYDVARLDEKLLLNELRSLGLQVRPLNIEEVAAPEGLGEVGVIRLAARSRVIPMAFTYEHSGGVAINNAMSLILSHDKYFTYLKLKEARVPTPETYLVFGREAAKEVARRLGYPVIVKPTDGSWGRFVNLVKSAEDLESLILQKAAMDSHMHLYLVQEFINKPNRDIRVTVVGDRAVAAIYRITNGDWRTNTARGGKAEPVKIDPELEDVAVRASKAVGAYYSGVDVVESERGYLVLEVNGVPEFKNVQRVTGVNVAGEIARLVAEFVKK